MKSSKRKLAADSEDFGAPPFKKPYLKLNTLSETEIKSGIDQLVSSKEEYSSSSEHSISEFNNSNSSSSDDEPLAIMRKNSNAKKMEKKRKIMVSESSSGEDESRNMDADLSHSFSEDNINKKNKDSGRYPDKYDNLVNKKSKTPLSIKTFKESSDSDSDVPLSNLKTQGKFKQSFTKSEKKTSSKENNSIKRLSLSKSKQSNHGLQKNSSKRRLSSDSDDVSLSKQIKNKSNVVKRSSYDEESCQEFDYDTRDKDLTKKKNNSFKSESSQGKQSKITLSNNKIMSSDSESETLSQKHDEKEVENSSKKKSLVKQNRKSGQNKKNILLEKNADNKVSNSASEDEFFVKPSSSKQKSTPKFKSNYENVASDSEHLNMDSEDEPLGQKSKNKQKKLLSWRQKKKTKQNIGPDSKLSDRRSKVKIYSSDSEDESFVKESATRAKENSKLNKISKHSSSENLHKKFLNADKKNKKNLYPKNRQKASCSEDVLPREKELKRNMSSDSEDEPLVRLRTSKQKQILEFERDENEASARSHSRSSSSDAEASSRSQSRSSNSDTKALSSRSRNRSSSYSTKSSSRSRSRSSSSDAKASLLRSRSRSSSCNTKSSSRSRSRSSSCNTKGSSRSRSRSSSCDAKAVSQSSNSGNNAKQSSARSQIRGSKRANASSGSSSSADSDEELLNEKFKAKQNNAVGGGTHITKSQKKKKSIGHNKKTTFKNSAEINSSDDDSLAAKQLPGNSITKNSVVSNGKTCLNDSDSELSEKEEAIPKKKESKSNTRNTKVTDPLDRYKKYLNAMGIRINNYKKFFENCSSIQKKKKKILGLMEEKGLKGRPTIEKCKKVKRKLERKKEVEELDLTNIITERGRGRRNVWSVYQKADSDVQSPEKPTISRRIVSDSESE